MNYLLHILIMLNIYLILSLSFNLLIGYTGLISLCHAVFYGMGAYTSTLLMVKLGWNFFYTLPLGIIVSMIMSLLVSVPSVRLKGSYFILTGLAFQVIVYSILYNWVPLTRGPYGIYGIPMPQIFGLEITTHFQYLILCVVLAGVSFIILWRLLFSPFGRVLKAIREDEIATESMGKNVVNFKIVAFMIAAGIAAVAGSFYAGYVTFIDPTSFTIHESVFILSIVIVGGAGNLRGPVIGTAVLILLPEILNFLRIPDTIAPNVREMIYGALLILLMRYRTHGITGEYKFE